MPNGTGDAGIPIDTNEHGTPIGKEELVDNMLGTKYNSQYNINIIPNNPKMLGLLAIYKREDVHPSSYQ